jgi:hypothetical protein
MAKTLTLSDYGAHQCFIGSTDSGKTTLAKEELRFYDRYLILDSKKSFSDIDGVKINTPKQLAWHFLIRTKRIIYQPDRKYRTKGEFEALLERIMDSSNVRRKNKRIVWIDEIYHWGYGSQSFPPGMPIAMATCRESGVSLWINIQRPKNVPLQIFTESRFMNIFYLTRLDDIKTVSEYARQDVKKVFNLLIQQKRDFRFVRIDLQTGEFDTFPPVAMNK